MDFYLKSGKQEGMAVARNGSLFVGEALQHIPLRHALHKQNPIFPVTFLTHTPAPARTYAYPILFLLRRCLCAILGFSGIRVFLLRKEPMLFAGLRIEGVRMLTKCPECEREISEKAHTCPHCGLPLFASKIKTAAKTGVTTSISRISSGAVSLKRGSRILGIHLIKLLAILLLLFALAIPYRILMVIATVEFGLRIIINVFLPFFWVPVLKVTRRLYGVKPIRALYYISIVMMCIGVLAECGIYGVPVGQVFLAVLTKVIGTIWYALAFSPRNETVHDGESQSKVENEQG